ncbi:MAG: nucleoside recognition protein [Rikenellaceae bacterium]
MTQRFVAVARDAVRPTIKLVLWLLKLMLPIMLAVSLLSYYGVMEYVSSLFSPFFEFIGLGGDASIVFMTSICLNIYSAIGVIAGLSLDIREVTILATMCLISHNMIIETKIQQKAGANGFVMVLLRISMSLFAAWCLNLVLPDKINSALVIEQAASAPQSLLEVVSQWFFVSLPLVIKLVCIIYSLHLLQGILIEYKLMPLLTKPLAPLMKIMGLPESTTLTWLIANTLGLAYGGVAIVNEVDKGLITKQESKYLNTSIAITHSLIEDTLLFVALGVMLWWTILPRFILSITAVWGQKLYMKIKYR